MSRSLLNSLTGACIGVLSGIATFLCFCLLGLPWFFFVIYLPLFVTPFAIFSSIVGGAVTGLALASVSFSRFPLLLGALAGLLAGLLLGVTGMYTFIMTTIGLMLNQHWSFTPITMERALFGIFYGSLFGMLFGGISARLTCYFLKQPAPAKRQGRLRFTLFNSLFGALILMATIYTMLILRKQYQL